MEEVFKKAGEKEKMNVTELFWFIGGACMGMLLGEMLAVVAFVKGRKKP